MGGKLGDIRIETLTQVMLLSPFWRRAVAAPSRQRFQAAFALFRGKLARIFRVLLQAHVVFQHIQQKIQHHAHARRKHGAVRILDAQFILHRLVNVAQHGFQAACLQMPPNGINRQLRDAQALQRGGD